MRYVRAEDGVIRISRPAVLLVTARAALHGLWPVRAWPVRAVLGRSAEVPSATPHRSSSTRSLQGTHPVRALSHHRSPLVESVPSTEHCRYSDLDSIAAFRKAPALGFWVCFLPVCVAGVEGDVHRRYETSRLTWWTASSLRKIQSETIKKFEDLRRLIRKTTGTVNRDSGWPGP
jgi:hypothetical protein